MPEPTSNPVPVPARSVQPSAPALHLESVDVSAHPEPTTILVHDVNWQVHLGERWLVTGRPGVGKSTVLQVAAGLIRPARGRQRLFGMDVTELNEDELLARRTRIGMVFGGSGRLFTHLTVAENLALPLLYHASREATEAALGERLECTLEILDLTEYARRRPTELPRSILPRVALARALVLAPEVLLLDDPTGNLPPEESEWWRTLISEAGNGLGPTCTLPTTWILAATDLRRWKTLANRFATLENSQWQVQPDPPEPDAGLRPAAAA